MKYAHTQARHAQISRYSRKIIVGRGSLVTLLVLILTQSCEGTDVFYQKPMSTSALVGTIVQFNCTVEGAASVTYLVNNMIIAEVASIGVSLSAPVYSSSQTTLYLYVPVTRSMDNWPVVCIAILPDGGFVASSPPAYLHVQAPPSAPQHLTANGIGATYVVLTWSQPKDTGLGGDLSYKVSYQDINGTSHNMTTNTTYMYHNVTDLFPNTTYTMTVMADNGIAGNEDNKSVSVNVTTKATDTITTVTPHTVTTLTRTSPDVVVLVVAMCMVVGVMVLMVAMVVMVVVLFKNHKCAEFFEHGTNNDVKVAQHGEVAIVQSFSKITPTMMSKVTKCQSSNELVQSFSKITPTMMSKVTKCQSSNELNI